MQNWIEYLLVLFYYVCILLCLWSTLVNICVVLRHYIPWPLQNMDLLKQICEEITETKYHAFNLIVTDFIL